MVDEMKQMRDLADRLAAQLRTLAEMCLLAAEGDTQAKAFLRGHTSMDGEIVTRTLGKAGQLANGE